MWKPSLKVYIKNNKMGLKNVDLQVRKVVRGRKKERAETSPPCKESAGREKQSRRWRKSDIKTDGWLLQFSLHFVTKH